MSAITDVITKLANSVPKLAMVEEARNNLKATRQAILDFVKGFFFEGDIVIVGHGHFADDLPIDLTIIVHRDKKVNGKTHTGNCHGKQQYQYFIANGKMCFLLYLHSGIIILLYLLHIFPFDPVHIVICHIYCILQRDLASGFDYKISDACRNLIGIIVFTVIISQQPVYPFYQLFRFFGSVPYTH